MADALFLINECIRTQNPYLDLGRCGLTDDLVAEGTSIDIALRQCTHLKTLILSNEWLDMRLKKRNKSRNKGSRNYFTSPISALAFLYTLEKLYCAGDLKNNWAIKTMDFISNLISLTTVDISYNKIEELNGLNNLIKLQYLGLRNNQIKELKGLDSLLNLTYLDIRYNQIIALKGLENLSNLCYFYISNNQILELKGLDRLSNIKYFEIKNNNIEDRDLGGIEKLINLEHFNISSNSIENLNGIEKLTNLQYFNISSNSIENLNRIEKLTKLQHFNISSNAIKSLEGIKKLKKLEYLDISFNFIQDLDEIVELINLKHIDIKENRIVELICLEKLTKLEHLDVSHNHILKLTEMGNVSNLQYFDVSYNYIKSLSGIEYLKNLQYLYAYYNNISNLQGLKDNINLLHLDIFDNNIEKLEGIKDLINLQRFNISNNKIEELKELASLSKLEYFNISENNIKELKELENTYSLLQLDISHNNITKLKGLENLSNLQHFDISYNKIVELRGLENLYSLQHFNISYNSIIELKGLINLSSLQHFNISHNDITELKGLEYLIELRHFDIYNNQISELKGLDNLTFLQYFIISSNQISELKGLENLISLAYFGIGYNQIRELKGLDTLINLKEIYLFGNQITELRGLEHLVNLEKISLWGNEITNIRPLKRFIEKKENPFKILFKENIEKWEIAISNNSLSSPPIDIIEQGNDAILEWFDANKEFFNEVKVLLIGDAKTGKTSLWRCLKEGICKPDEEQTDGIIIEPFSFKDLKTFQDYPSLHEAKAYFWDFGGQEVMSATHLFFMTHRSIYLVLLEARKDQKADEQLRELMEQVKNFGGNSQVIVVVNKIDLNRGFSLDSQVLQKDYPQIKAILYVSCQDNENINAVKQALAKAIPKTALYETKIDVRWKAIKEELQQQTNKVHYLSETNFMQVCEKHGLSKASEQLSAITFLHDLGILLHFEQLDLSEYFVLEPYWVTTGVYQILTSPFAQSKKGEIPKEDLKYIINEEEDKINAYCPQKRIRYGANEVRFIADIMTRFRLAYYTNNGETLLIPDLFENHTPLAETDLFTEATDALRLVYEYSYLPKSIMPRFMVEMQRDIRLAWRTGVILHCKQRNNTEALVMVREKQISITIKGDFMQKREYLSVIRFFLDKINENLNLKSTLLIPLPNYKGQFVKYEILLKMERAGETTYMNWEVEKEFLISTLLEGIERKEVIDRQGNTIINNYNITNVKGNDNKVIQDANKSDIRI